MMQVMAKPVMAILYREERVLQAFLQDLPVERLSEPFYFEGLQKYYGREMGAGLYKVFTSLQGLMQREKLKEYKLWAMEKERDFSQEGRRRLNIDPGLVEESHLVLASSKRRGGRLYLGQGVYAEIEYLFVHGSFRPLYWTYGDYRDRRVREFFQRVREDFLRDLNLARQSEELVVHQFTQKELHQEFKGGRPVGEKELKP